MAQNDISQKRVVIFATTYFPLVGGAEVAMKEVTDRLPGWQFDLVCARIKSGLPSTEKIGNVTVHRVGFGYPIDKYLLPFFGPVVALWLHPTSYRLPPVAWSLMASYGGFAALVYTWIRPRTKMLLTLQEGDPLEHYAKRAGKLEFLHEKIFKRADTVQAISHFLAGWATKMGFSGTPEVVPNGVDIGKFSRKSKVESRKSLREQLGYRDDDVVIVTASRLSLKNGVDDLIRSLTSLPASYKVLIAGEGEDAEKLRVLVEQKGLGSRVMFLGKKTHDELPELLQASDIFVRASLSEGLGISFLEAMAAGIPIIGTPVGGIPDFLTDGETGVFCKPRDPESIAKAVVRIQEEPQLKEKLIKQGENLIREKYGWEGIANKVGVMLKDVSTTNILLATGIFPPDVGGPSRMLEALSRSLKDNGFEVKILTYADEAGREDGVYRVSRKQTPLLMYIRYFFQMWKLSRWSDVVYVTDVYSVGYFAYLIKKISGKKYIVRFAGDSAWEIATSKGWTKDYITDLQDKVYDKKIEKIKARRKKILANADGIIAVCNFLAELAIKIGANREKIKVIYNAVNFSERKEDRRIGLRDRFGQGAKLMVYSGRLVPWKGLEVIIQIMPALKSRFGNIHFLILGDGQEYSNLKNLTHSLGLVDNVHFEGRVEQFEVINYLKETDLFVLNTNYEGMSHAILDAMEAGIPVITTKVGGNPEIIEDGKEGLLVNYNDTDGLKAGIIKILSDVAFALSLVANSKEKLKIFNWNDNIRETTKFIHNVIYEKSPLN